jgi:mRNA-degrading endonuclease toxin of MazEF toxin-antitoxin module
MEATGLPKDSLVLAHQIRTIAKERLGEKCGDVNPTAKNQVPTAL